MKSINYAICGILLVVFSTIYQQSEISKLQSACQGSIGLDRSGEFACFSQKKAI